jgi:cytidylate kinase
MIVAIDGPGGVGKSTAARGLARRLSLPYLNTGAMYRALALEVLSRGVDPADEAAVAREAENLDLRTRVTEDGSVEILLNGEPLGERIRTERVGQVSSQVAAYPQVRRVMVAVQQRIGRQGGGVVEGRDIGTVVFPETPYKFFLEADAEVRVERRYLELVRRGYTDVPRDRVRAEMRERDQRDAGRDDSPLTKDETYVVVDTSHLTADEVVERMVAVISEIDEAS